ncbi:Tn3 family transposase [Listeria booriae]|uniref:Transposase n=1 Tax=Listeria booriae TaxID=1552123 RepID=A0A099W0R7_9LIST|nr:Tn3 family transposase [Listeria booriae]KGL37963.1 transposase [Listeria booriae]STY45965.1 Transposase and inactivated derivatives, TnpA family [Listeria booriae]
MRRQELFTAEQRQEWMRLPTERRDLERHYTFSKEDLSYIKRHRGAVNRLGYAVQLALVRFPGWSSIHFIDIPTPLLTFIAKQLGVTAPIRAFRQYPIRENTYWEHQKEIRDRYAYRLFQVSDYRKLTRLLRQHAMENNHTYHLMQICLQELRTNQFIFPPMLTMERMIWEAREKATNHVYSLFFKQFSLQQQKRLDQLIAPPSDNRITTWGWLKEGSGKSSPEAFIQLTHRLECIRELRLSELSLKHIHPARFRQLAQLGGRYKATAFRRFSPEKKYTLMAAHLMELSQDYVDQAFDIHTKQIQTLQSKGKKKQELLQQQNGKKINEKLHQFVEIGACLMEAKKNQQNPYLEIEKKISWEEMITSIEETKGLIRPKNYDYLDLIASRFSYLRKYIPTLLRTLEFTSMDKNNPVTAAVTLLKEVNLEGKRTITPDAPVDFLPKKWKKYVINKDQSINKAYYEIATLSELRNHVRAGNIAIEGSRSHKNFDDYLIPKEEWDDFRKADVALSMNHVAAEAYLQDRSQALTDRLQWLTENKEALQSVQFENGRIALQRLEKETPDEAKQLSHKLYQMLPKMKLTEILMEVAHWTQFDTHFTHTATSKSPSSEEKPVLLATLMALGTNIGLTKMGDATPDVTYFQMANVRQWRMHEDAMLKAQATLVNFVSQQKLATCWGDGSTSSSDGMRVPISVPALNAEHNPHYGSKKGATIYRFVSDQYSSFYSKVIHTNTRDAVHVLDGLLLNETELNIQEHYTDTAGYTDQVFGLMFLLGFRFAPRIRDISDAKLFQIMGEVEAYPDFSDIIRGQVNTASIVTHFDDVLRLAASVKEGTVASSLIMSKLRSYKGQNKVAMALQEIGRIEKTLFILDYISSEPFRRRVHRGLNKGELTNALGRALSFGKKGELRERSLPNQLQYASSLNILINAISAWNTVYLEKAVHALREKEPFDEALLEHISPLGWEHINFLGEYRFPTIDEKLFQSLKPLDI